MNTMKFYDTQVMVQIKVDFKTMTNAQLEELRDRQLVILHNKLVLKNLSDKGERTKTLLKKLEDELEERKLVDKLESQMKAIDLNKANSSHPNPKYVEHICGIEKNEEVERFKPFRTPKIMAISKPSKQIALRESVELQSNQAIRVQEEYIKIRYRQNVEVEDESSESSNDESSDNELSDNAVM